MTKELQRASIAHGDLQHGNVFVVSGELRLVDYDGMYVPSLSGKTSHEVGHRNYQHPHRTEHDFAPYLDNFSAWVIYISLIALSIDPSLWHLFGAGDECLLFRREDFNLPESSHALHILDRSQDSRIQQLVKLFRSHLHVPLSRVPPLDGAETLGDNIARERPQGQQGWLSDYVAFPPPKDSAAVAVEEKAASSGDSWIRDHVQQQDVQPIAFEFAAIQDRLAFLFLLGALLLLGYGIFFEPLAVFLSGTAVALIPAFLIYRYRILPDVQARRRLHKERNSLASQVIVLERGLQALEEERRSVDNVERRKLLEREKLEQKLFTGETREIRDADEKLQTTLRNLGSRRSSVKREESDAIRQVHTQLQAKIRDIPRQLNLIDQNKSFELSKLDSMGELRNASIQGIGPKLKSRLLRAGITTASDITPSRVSAIHGFGNLKTAAVLRWREWVGAHIQSEEARIRGKYSSQRQTLQSQEETAKRQAQTEEEVIHRKHKPTLDTLDSEEQRARNDANRMIDLIRKRYQAEHLALESQKEKATKEAELQRKGIDSKIEVERRSVPEMRLEFEKIQRQLSGYSQVTFGTYLRRVLRV